MPLSTLKELLVEQLVELLAGETHTIQVLPKLARAASSPKLADALDRHAEETREHIARLEKVFRIMELRPHRVESKGMKGLLDDCIALANKPRIEPHVRDAALIAVAQHVDHDEIAGYGCAKTWARLLGLEEVSMLLDKSLADERRSDANLTKIAETLNKSALEPIAM